MLTGDDIGRLRRAQAGRPFLPYERLAGSDRVVDPESLRERIKAGLTTSESSPLSLSPPIPWEEAFKEDRSKDFHFQSWDFLGPVLCELCNDPESDLLPYAVSVAEDWAIRYPSLEAPSRMAWYDMAVGIRAYRLAFIVDLAARSSAIGDETMKALFIAVGVHQEALDAEAIFKSHSNHGLYVAAGQLALARRLDSYPGMDGQESQATDRLREMLRTQFSSEGVHKEHSPDYHRMVLDTVRAIYDSQLITDPELINVKDIEEALAWFVMPDGVLVTLGDTPRRTLRTFNAQASPELTAAISGGRKGTPPETRWRAFPESGYAVFRDGWPTARDREDDWSYLLLNAAFHSRTHKHADDLSIVWYDRGSEILVDPGRFGYVDPISTESELGKQGFYYGHPYRVYVEETRAHNTVEIDGASYQREGVNPYGSGLLRTGEDHHLFYAEAMVEHATLLTSSLVHHHRIVIFNPADWLLVYDHLWDPTETSHDFRQWFQFAPNLEVRPDDIGWSMGFEQGQHLWVIPLLGERRSNVMRGETEPRLQGWISPQDNVFEPTSSVFIEASASSDAQIATLFQFGPHPPIPGSSNTSADSLEFSWMSRNRSSRLRADLGDPAQITLSWLVGR